MDKIIKKGVAITALLIISGCGEPLAPVASKWELAAAVPDEYGSFRLCGVGPKGVYGVSEDRRKLIVYDGSTFKEDFVAPGNVEFGDVAFLEREGWLVAARTFGLQSDVPALFRYVNGQWDEVNCDLAGVDALWEPTPVAPGECLFIARTFPDDKKHVAKFDHGDFSVNGDFSVHSYGLGYAKKTGYLFCQYESEYFFISADRGTTWNFEILKPPAPYEILKFLDFDPSPEALFITAQLETREFAPHAVLKRTGSPGDGRCEFSYLGYTPVGFYRVEECAFVDDDHGVATGPGASMFYDGVNWIREEVGPDEYYRNVVADPRGGFWATDAVYRNLYWHP